MTALSLRSTCPKGGLPSDDEDQALHPRLKMPLSSEFDSSQAIITVICGAISAGFHWAATQTSDKELPKKVIRGQMIASFASGAVVAWLLNIQTVYTIDPIGAFCAAAVVGFSYGPVALQIAAKKAAGKIGISPPETPEASPNKEEGPQ